MKSCGCHIPTCSAEPEGYLAYADGLKREYFKLGSDLSLTNIKYGSLKYMEMQELLQTGEWLQGCSMYNIKSGTGLGWKGP